MKQLEIVAKLKFWFGKEIKDLFSEKYITEIKDNFVYIYKTESERTWSSVLSIISLQEALTYALTQINSNTERRLVAQEFWHSLNRKKIVSNDEVQSLIDLTLAGRTGMGAVIEKFPHI